MAEGRDRAAWNHTAALVATVRNVNRARGKPPVDPRKIHPYYREGDETGGGHKAPKLESSLKEMKPWFIKTLGLRVITVPARGRTDPPTPEGA